MATAGHAFRDASGPSGNEQARAGASRGPCRTRGGAILSPLRRHMVTLFAVREFASDRPQRARECPDPASSAPDEGGTPPPCGQRLGRTQRARPPRRRLSTLAQRELGDGQRTGACRPRLGFGSPAPGGEGCDCLARYARRRELRPRHVSPPHLRRGPA